MRRLFGALALVFAVTLLVASGGSPAWAAPLPLSAPWQAKVDPWVLETSAQGETEFLVFLAVQADLSRASALTTKREKGQYVYETLTEVAERTQGPVRRALERLGVEYRPFWVANMIWVRGDRSVVEAMAQRSDVAHLYANPHVQALSFTGSGRGEGSAPQTLSLAGSGRGEGSAPQALSFTGSGRGEGSAPQSLTLAGRGRGEGSAPQTLTLAGSGRGEGSAPQALSFTGSGQGEGSAPQSLTLAGRGRGEGSAPQTLSLTGSGQGEGSAPQTLSLAGRGQGEGSAPQTVEWNITKVKAPDVWTAGYTGQGAVVAGQDTGYQWDHPALKGKYRGWNGSSADHDYNWHDAIHVGGSICGADAPVPCDDHNHGTHTMGTMVGDDGVGNQIGMAPGAKWIGCRNMNAGVGTPATYSECYQWFIAPTRVNGADPRPDLAPDVINNSWGCPPSEGCTDPNVLLTVVQNVRAAGIVTVHSAGNSGSSCATVSDPAAIYDESFTVGATDSNDNIASFSSRGPVTVDGSGRRKPDVSAPGVNIRSSVRGSGYQSGWSGTSMAGPHVAGQVALLLSAYPWLAGDVDQIEDIIADSVVPRTSSQSCGGDTPGVVPNNVYGWGRIDAWQAYSVGCRAPTVAPAVSISRVSATTVQLAWAAVPSAASYEVWWADNDPYFTPGGACSGNCAVVSATTFSQAILGNSVANRTYVVRAANPCVVAAALSNRSGEFEFDLAPGTP